VKRTTFLLLTLVALFLAACSSGQSDSSSAATATAEATEAPESEETPEPQSEATLEPGAGDLDAVLPDEVGGITIEYESSSGAEVMGSEGMTPEAQEFFDRVGADVSDLSSAFGFGLDAEAGTGISIIAFRVAGADEGRLRDEFRSTIEDDETQTVTEEQVAGKSVLALSTEGGDASGYVYVKGDIVFIVGGSPMSLVEEALSELP